MFTSRNGDRYRGCPRRPKMGNPMPKSGCMVLLIDKACTKIEEIVKQNKKRKIDSDEK